MNHNLNQRRHLQVRKQIEGNLAQHQVTQTLNSGLFRSWRCQKPGTWTYAFDVTTIPGWLFISGDIGELAVSREQDMIAWAKGSASDDVSYFAGKVCRDIKIREYSSDAVRAWADEQRKHYTPEDEGERNIFNNALNAIVDESDCGGEHEVYDVIAESLPKYLDDPPNFQAYTWGFLYRYEALRWLLARI